VHDRPEQEPTDEALARLEDVLLTLPFDRAVPELRELLHRADVDEALLLHDERALKLLHEALLARPFGSLDAVRQVRTEVELLTLEVELLADRLEDPDLAPGEVRRMSGRLAQVRTRLEQLHGQL
jgi:hypothetical protein